ncbi:MAG: TetR/AcrR family transcriptional regulator [Planctomycetota bacterium]
MRITAAAKLRTRERLLQAARRLLSRRTLAEVTTRELAEGGGIGHATLFNYFPTKEDLALALCSELLAQAEADFAAEAHTSASVDEALFAHAAAGLRRLLPYRAWAGTLLASALAPGLTPSSAPSPASAESLDGKASAPSEADTDTPADLQTRHLATVQAILARRPDALGPGPRELHLYWTLWIGVLGWWAADRSEHQQDTLGLLDQSLRLFLASLDGPAVRGDSP